jgi:phosphate starvation-inducible PhoH-like protein
MSKSKRLRQAATLDGVDQAVVVSSSIVADKSSQIYQRDKIRFDLNIRQRHELTENQKKLLEIMLDKKTKVVFIKGPAGTSKTFVAVYAGLLLLQRHTISDILYIRSVAESASKSLGTLPGEMDDKLSPFLMPLYDKLDELLPRAEVDKLTKEKRIEALPIGYLRGASWNARFIIADEAQNLDRKELTTLVTRLGEFSKLIVVGDESQSDINGKSGFMPFFDTFNDDTSRGHGIHSFSFTKDDIVRSGILRYIVERLETMPKS